MPDCCKAQCSTSDTAKVEWRLLRTLGSVVMPAGPVRIWQTPVPVVLHDLVSQARVGGVTARPRFVVGSNVRPVQQ